MTSLRCATYTGSSLSAPDVSHPSTQIEIVADDGNLCGEGPLWDDREGSLYWTDITGRSFYRYRWHEKRHEILNSGFQVGGFCQQRDGGFLVTNDEGFWSWRPGDAPVLLGAEADGEKCVLNDCAADPEGRSYSGSWHLDEQGRCAPSFLFRIDTDGTVHIADEGICFSNGVALAPERSTLYFADTVARCIYAYAWCSRDGALSNRRVFARIDRDDGIPDGLAVDAEGFLWCAHWFGGCLTRYDADGKRERRVSCPASQTSALTFGGPDLDEIYVTSAAQSNALVLAPAGYDPAAVFVGGPLYRLRLGIQGRLKYRSHVAVPLPTDVTDRMATNR
ncbi:MAG TPA: SMP-30/gluconolactonase/LRE family protein [Acidobacteriaceae bacterium]|nr:SMP-30/gluconolactonase/LRE family protein [Acidobacteriaceae bacterium]